MKNWRDNFAAKLCSADDAVRKIRNGQRVLVGGVGIRPEELVRAMIRNASSFRDVRIMHGLSSGGEDYCLPQYRENFLHESLFASKTTRKYIEDGTAKFYPNYFYELPHFFERGIIPVDVFIFQATPPNRYGYCSTGTNADFVLEGVAAADLVIMQINDQIPWCSANECLVHVNAVDHIVYYSEALPTIPIPEPNEEEKIIGEYCASLIHDRDTIQAGIGRIPNAVCQALENKKDLGVHSEMISDGLMELWKKGVITNRYKSFDPNVMVASFAYGTKDLYRFIDHNPAVQLRAVRYTNEPTRIAKCANLCCIMTCIETDLMGQIVSGTSGLRQISGAGGQLDFMRGAGFAYDGNGRAIMALTSTHVKNGKRVSRIKPFIEDGSAVTVTRQDADYFVTEYGIARVMGKTLKDRAREMIRIAHPDFRPELIETYERRFKQKF